MRSGIDERTGRRDNISMGDPAFHRQSLALNSGFGLGDDIEVYGFGTYTRRKASSAANYRLASGGADAVSGRLHAAPEQRRGRLCVPRRGARRASAGCLALGPEQWLRRRPSRISA